MKNIIRNFGNKDMLINWYANIGNDQIQNVNNHIHTPYSFSAFENMEQAFKMAKDEDITVLGINDFYVTDGYNEFYNLAVKNNIFPLFNIEFIGLLKKEQEQGIRINDPSNPGRTYFSGKGLDHPVHLDTKYKMTLDILKMESQKQVVLMIEKLNDHMKKIKSDLHFTYDEIKNNYAKDLVRERHLAKALRIAINDKKYPQIKLQDFLKQLYGGKESKVNHENSSAFEGELRSNLLKAGGVAFVPEDDRAFLEIPEIIEIIIHAGGIPTYPVLLDNAAGEITEFEKDYDKLYKRLTGLGVYSIELIPNRNKLDTLEDFVSFFHDKGFIVTFGTEHNAPELFPLTITTRGNTPLSSSLLKIGYEGACVVAAHEYLRAHEKDGYLDKKGKARIKERDEFALLGKAVIEKFLS